MTATRDRVQEVLVATTGRAATRDLLTRVVLIYLAMRLVSAVLIVWVASEQDPSLIPGGATGPRTSYWDETRMWDGKWYEQIARTGYPAQLPINESGGVDQNEWAFCPLYPLLVRVLMGLTGLPFGVVGSLVSTIAGAFVMIFVALLLRDRIGATASLWVTAVFSAAPSAPVFQLCYADSLSLALITACLYCLDRQRWWLVGAMAIACGLTRPTAAPLALVAVVAIVMRLRAQRWRPVRPAEAGAMTAAVLACFGAGLLWPAIAWWRTGVRSAYTDTQASWRGGEVALFKPWLTGLQPYLHEWSGFWVLAIVFALLAAVLGPWASALGPQLRVWTLAYATYLAAVTPPYTSTYRFLLPMFPLIVVLIGAGWRSAQRRVLVGLRAAVWLVLGLGWQVWWLWELLYVARYPDFPI